MRAQAYMKSQQWSRTGDFYVTPNGTLASAHFSAYEQRPDAGTLVRLLGIRLAKNVS
jgi:hypothetical protein